MSTKGQSKKLANFAADPQSAPVECPFVKQATEAFLVFDSTGNETVDVREVGTIIRSLGKSSNLILLTNGESDLCYHFDKCKRYLYFWKIQV